MKNLFLALSLSHTMIAFCTHYAGGELSYRYIGDSTNTPLHYEVTARIFVDPSTMLIVNVSNISISSSCFSTVNLSLYRDFPQLPPSLSQSNLECFFGDSLAYIYPYYELKNDVVLPNACHDIKFFSSNCCRDQSDNIVGGVNNHNFIMEAYLNNLHFENSLTFFTNDAAIGLCPGASVEWPIEFQNPDADSIVFSLVPVKSNNNVAYASGYSYQDPVMTQTGTPFWLHPTKAILTMTPSAAQQVTVVMEFREYKHNTNTNAWIEVGRGYKDFKVVVVQSCPNHYTIPTLNIGQVNCHDKILEIDFNQSMQSSSIEKGGSDFVIYGPDHFIFPIDSLQKIVGSNPERTSSVKIQLLDSVMLNGTYHIVSRIGNDFNTIFTTCGFDIPALDTIATFTIADANCGNISVDEMDLPQVKIYPNPVMDQLTIESHNGRNFSVLVHDVQGRLLIQKENLIEKQIFDTAELDAGVYFIKVFSRNTLLVREKIIKL